MKLTFGKVTLYFGVSIAKTERFPNIIPSSTYFSKSCGRIFQIREMETTHIKNALLKSMGLSILKSCESETIVRELANIKCWDGESLGLYLELMGRVNAQVI